MRILKLVTSMVMLLSLITLAASVGQAQDTDAPRRVITLYYEDENPNRLDVFLLIQNLCLEPVLMLNPGLDVEHIEYGQRLNVPTDEPCYDFSNTHGYNTSDGNPPRLKYYENGQWLAEPYYSDQVVYTGGTLESIARGYRVCVDELLEENILLQNIAVYQAFAQNTSLDVFLPEDSPPCYIELTDPEHNLLATSDYRWGEVSIAAGSLTPASIAQQFNVCYEELPYDWFSRYRGVGDTIVTVYLPTDRLPCYNQAGERLLYVSDDGQRLSPPVYSDLPVYITGEWDTLPEIAARFGVCFVDLVRLNPFAERSPDSRIQGIEVRIPPARPCPRTLEVSAVTPDPRRSLVDFALRLNICLGDLLRLNPHLDTRTGSALLASGESVSVVREVDAAPCYESYRIQNDETIFDIERKLNRCYETLIVTSRWEGEYPHNTRIEEAYTRRDAAPCYNEWSERLQFPPEFAEAPAHDYWGVYNYQDIGRILAQESIVLTYSPMPIHVFRRSDTVYSISREYNVCVHDLLRANPTLVSQMPTGYPTFIPITRPCYDDATGMPLIYEDEEGNPLLEPRIGDALIYYGSQPRGYVSHYYNVCLNRIEDANQEKTAREVSYLGWIIPTDRPPCYDQDGASIDYVCYQQPIELWADYRLADQKITLDYDGTHCYDLADPETIVWYENRPYIVIDYYGTRLESRAFTGWCFGVSLDEIDAINDVPAILDMLPYRARAIPLPTRDCYLVNRDVLADAPGLHVVREGETLVSIARRFETSVLQIADANDVDVSGTIWVGQTLVIPEQS